MTRKEISFSTTVFEERWLSMLGDDLSKYNPVKITHAWQSKSSNVEFLAYRGEREAMGGGELESNYS